MYKTISSAVTAELTEKRSRFICLAAPVGDEAAALSLLEGVRARHRDANHNCHAYILRAGSLQRYSDDGEPSGTAGMPILEVLRHKGLVDIIAVVTRYFGGTLLGAGGLVRAYSSAAALALERAVTIEMHPCTVFSLELPYQLHSKLRGLLARFGGQTLSEEFSDTVRLQLRIRADKFPAFNRELADVTAGSVSAVLLREEFAQA